MVNFLKEIRSGVENAQIKNFGELLELVEKHGSLEAAQKAEPQPFIEAGLLSVLAGHPGKGPSSE
jgi:hypothetical protein